VAELIPKSAAAIIANLAAAQVGPMLILALVFVILVNCLNRSFGVANGSRFIGIPPAYLVRR
jgi:hypothetical protein